jgi:hypothetical protein
MLEPTRPIEGHRPARVLGTKSAPLMSPQGKKRKTEESKEQKAEKEEH